MSELGNTLSGREAARALPTPHIPLSGPPSVEPAVLDLEGMRRAVYSDRYRLQRPVDARPGDLERCGDLGGAQRPVLSSRTS
jgi:hypothetical protein